MPQFIRFVLPATIVALSCLPTAAQSGLASSVESPSDTVQTTEAVLAPIHQLFDGMRAGDSAAVRAAFDPIARLVRTSNQNGIPSHRVMSVDDFVTAVGTPHDVVWDERIWDIRTEIRDNLASVWMKFAFFAGTQFSHCGVNSAELVNTDEGWKIVHLADTTQRDGCEMPPESE
ncbi:nuclear transport factor 2 family protein [Bacteroidota bacterium]